LDAHALFLFAEFGGEDGGEVFGLGELADFDFGAFVEGSAFQPFDGVLHGVDTPEPEAGDELFGFGEGAVGDGALRAGEFDAGSLCAGTESLGGEQTSSSLYWPMRVSISLLGRPPASDSLVAFTMTMTLIAFLLFRFRLKSCSTYTSNDKGRVRQVALFFC
jgi:hypothetical protein